MFNWGIMAGCTLSLSACVTTPIAAPAIIQGAAALAGAVEDIGQLLRMAAIVLTCLFTIWGEQPQRSYIIGGTAVGTALGGYILSDDHAFSVHIDLVTAALCAGWLYSLDVFRTAKLAAGAEFCVWAYLLGRPSRVPGQAGHMTWWGIATLAARLLTFTVSETVDLLGSTQLIVSLTVLIGTWAMSLSECGMLVTALADFGPLGYVMGNFALHYYPVTRALTIPAASTTGGVTAAIVLVTVYSTTMDAVDVYSCNGMASWVAVVGIPLSAAVCAVLLLNPAAQWAASMSTSACPPLSAGTSVWATPGVPPPPPYTALKM